MSEPEVLWESNPQFVVEYGAYESFSLSPQWEAHSFHETVDEAKETAQDIAKNHSNVRVVKYGTD